MKTTKVLAAVLCAAMLAGCQAAPAETTLETAAEETVVTEAEVTETEQTEPAETTEAFVLGDDGFLPEYETFELTSEDLHNGVWDNVISNTLAGENVSPQLSWEPVDDALFYVVYMVDMTANYWIHWAYRSINTNFRTSFPAASSREYPSAVQS